MSTHPHTAAVCYRHPGRSTRLACSECGRPICLECSHDAAVGQKCPECARHVGRGRVIEAGTMLRPSARSAPVTFTLMAVSGAVFLASLLSPELQREFLLNFSQLNGAVAAGEWWRIFTAAFLHAPGIFHIAFNMWALYIFGPPLERQVGPGPFLALYLSSAAAGGAFAFLLGSPRDLLVGASGAIFGLFGAWLYASFRNRRSPAGNAQFRMLLILLGINGVLSLTIPEISWQGHLGGLLGGFAIAGLWGRLGTDASPALRALVASSIGLVAIVLVLFA